MKNRSINHSDHWATPPFVYEELNKEFNFNFDPCPYRHDLTEWDGLCIEWRDRNYINPPYSRKLKERFIKKAIEESKKGKLCVMLIPASTSTKILHEHVLPNASNIIFRKGRIPFIGVNTKGQLVNWHLWDREPPFNGEHVRANGMHDSLIVVFDGLKKSKVA
jgi:site-specific DNA-methyltransferase (adenine-specific)